MCMTCSRWVRHAGSRYGRCAKARKGPQPYWFGTVIKHDQIDTPDIRDGNCAARIAR